jgi:hypothetical protein
MPSWAQAIGRTVTAILSAVRAAPSFLEQRNAMLRGNETKADAGRIAVTVRPIARRRRRKHEAKRSKQLGALSPKFGKDGLGEYRRSLGNSALN